MRQKLLLLIAVFFGVLAFLLTHHQINMERRRIMGAAEEVSLVRINKDLTAGERITAEDISPVLQRRFRGSGSSEVPYSRANAIIGRELAFAVQGGSILLWNYLKPEDTRWRGGLERMIPDGRRAVSISVDATASVTGLVRPGNRVDIIGTFRFPEMRGDQQFDTLTLTILQNVVVLATGANYGQGALGDSTARGYSTVTLELTPKEAEMIIFASQKGRLHLSLRNFEDAVYEADLQSVNFKFLQDHIPTYTEERRHFMIRHPSARGGR